MFGSCFLVTFPTEMGINHELCGGGKVYLSLSTTPPMFVSVLQYLLDPAKGMTGAEVNQLHVHGGSALMEVGVVVLVFLSAVTGQATGQAMLCAHAAQVKRNVIQQDPCGTYLVRGPH